MLGVHREHMAGALPVTAAVMYRAHGHRCVPFSSFSFFRYRLTPHPIGTQVCPTTSSFFFSPRCELNLRNNSSDLRKARRQRDSRGINRCLNPSLQQPKRSDHEELTMFNFDVRVCAVFLA